MRSCSRANFCNFGPPPPPRPSARRSSNFRVITYQLTLITHSLLGGPVFPGSYTTPSTIWRWVYKPLNALTGNPDPAPECAQVLPDGTLVPQPESDTNQVVEAGKTESGATAGSTALSRGVSRWECCIHPWMRMVVVVHERED